MHPSVQAFMGAKPMFGADPSKPPFIRRDSLVEQIVTDILDAQMASVLLRAPPAVGKTALLQAIARRLSQLGKKVAVVECATYAEAFEKRDQASSSESGQCPRRDSALQTDVKQKMEDIGPDGVLLLDDAQLLYSRKSLWSLLLKSTGTPKIIAAAAMDLNTFSPSTPFNFQKVYSATDLCFTEQEAILLFNECLQLWFGKIEENNELREVVLGACEVVGCRKVYHAGLLKAILLSASHSAGAGQKSMTTPLTPSFMRCWLLGSDIAAAAEIRRCYPIHTTEMNADIFAFLQWFLTKPQPYVLKDVRRTRVSLLQLKAVSTYWGRNLPLSKVSSISLFFPISTFLHVTPDRVICMHQEIQEDAHEDKITIQNVAKHLAKAGVLAFLDEDTVTFFSRFAYRQFWRSVLHTRAPHGYEPENPMALLQNVIQSMESRFLLEGKGSSQSAAFPSESAFQHHFTQKILSFIPPSWIFCPEMHRLLEPQREAMEDDGEEDGEVDDGEKEEVKDVQQEEEVESAESKKQKGALDIFVGKSPNEAWGYELLVQGRERLEHARRFAPGGKYDLKTISHRIVVDIRQKRPKKRIVLENGVQYVAVTFDSTYQNATLDIPKEGGTFSGQGVQLRLNQLSSSLISLTRQSSLTKVIGPSAFAPSTASSSSSSIAQSAAAAPATAALSTRTSASAMQTGED